MCCRNLTLITYYSGVTECKSLTFVFRFVLCTRYFGAAMVIYDVVARMRRETIKFVYFFGLFTRNLASKIKFSNLTERREF